jgi:hypothetical protein
MKKWCLVFIFGCISLLTLQGATVSVLVVETGLPPGAEQRESASVWESGIMDALFDAGHIVSNAPVLRISGVPGGTPGGEIPPEARRDFDEARLGGSDFFVLVFLSYPDGGEHPREICIRVFSVNDGEMLYETFQTARSWESPEAEFQDAKRNGGRIIPRLAHKG